MNASHGSASLAEWEPGPSPAWVEQIVGAYALRHRPATGALRVLVGAGSVAAEAYLGARATVVLAETSAAEPRAHALRPIDAVGLPTPHRAGEADLVLVPTVRIDAVGALLAEVRRALAPGGIAVLGLPTDSSAMTVEAVDEARLVVVEHEFLTAGVSVLVVRDPRPEPLQPPYLAELDRSSCIDRERVLDAVSRDPWTGPARACSGSASDLLEALQRQLREGEPNLTTLPWPAPRPSLPNTAEAGCDVLAVMPHPDDESIYVGGTIAGLSTAGQRVRLLTLTDGAGGRGGDGLPALRRGELLAAARVLGIEEVRVLGWRDFGKYRDGARTQPVTGGDTLRTWGLETALLELVAELRRARPRRVLGLHPQMDPNLSLHGHHLAAGLLLTLAFHAAADPEFAPRLGPAWTIEEHRVVMPPCHASWAEPFEFDRELKRRASGAHRSQSYSTARLSEALADPTRPAVEHTMRLQGRASAPWVSIRRGPGAAIDAGVDWKAEAARVTEMPRPRTALVDILRQQAGQERTEEIERSLRMLRREGSVAVVTGQQVGLLGGPVYTLAKALSAVAMARRLTRSGVDAVPIFWLASQDHDLDEVQRVVRLEAPTLDLGQSNDGRPVGRRALGPEISALWERFVDDLPPGYDAALVERLGAAMAPNATFTSSFTAVLREAMRGTGLLVLDPDDPTFARLAAPLLRRAARETGAVEQALGRARERLAAEGKCEVIATDRGGSPVFFVGDDGRRRRLENDGLDEALSEDPRRLSAAALLRPLVQDLVLPTIAIVAGPTERKYLDQTHELYEWAGIPRPTVVARASIVPVESGDAAALMAVGGLERLRRSPRPLEVIGRTAMPPASSRWLGRIDAAIAELHDAQHPVRPDRLMAALEPAYDERRALPRLHRTWPWWQRVVSQRIEALRESHRAGPRRRARGRLRGELLRLRRSILRDGRRLAGPAVDAWCRVGSVPAPPERRMTVAELLLRGGSSVPGHLLAALEFEPSPELTLWLGASS